MLDWSRLEPLRFERAVQALLRRLDPDLVSIDGAGGDDGRDAERPITTWQTGDGLEAFEIKSHSGRLEASQRRQVRRSLEKAVAKLTEMRRWTLVIGLNPTPGELNWFRTTLQAAAPDVDLTWCGRDWLDEQIAGHKDLANYIEGPMSELLRAAGEHNLEREVLAAGMDDLAARHVALQARVDDMSPHWTLDTTMRADGPSFAIRAKHAGAAEDDPITLRPQFEFSKSDPDAMKALDDFNTAVEFGGQARLDDTIVKGLQFQASEEVLRMLGPTATTTTPGTLIIGRPPQPMDRPFRATVQTREGGPTGKVLTSIDVSFTKYSAGTGGGLVYGEDAAGTVRVRLKLPKPPEDDDQLKIAGGEFNISFTNPWEFSLADITTALALQAELAEGAHLCIRATWARMSIHRDSYDIGDPRQLRALTRAAIALARLEELLDIRLALPTYFDGTELAMIEAAVRSLEGERVRLPEATMTMNLEPGTATGALKNAGEKPTEFRLAMDGQTLTIGDVQIPFGPYGILIQKGRVTNVHELQAASDDEPVVAVVEPVDGPIYLLSRDEARAALGKLAKPDTNAS